MNTEFLRGFVEIARRKSIAKASEALHLTHTALSKQLQSLEKQLDVRLVTRSSSGVELTEAGQLVYEEAVHVLERLSTLNEALGAHREWSRLTIATLPDIAARYLSSAALSELKKQGREVELALHHATQEAYESLLQGVVDVLVAERVSKHPSVWMTDLYREPLFAVMPADHTMAARSLLSLEELSRERLILYPYGCTIRAKLTSLFEASGLPMNIATEIGFHEMILGYVTSGSGMTVLPESLVWHVAPSRIRILPLDDADACRTIAVASLQPDKAAKLLPHLRQAFTAAPTLATPKI
ncbi:LysR family transcriptional regulator [Paenibacillus chartarius]|uniref:LysR family transcriptional regulator n=1 Tax=Paenibacillus chartarius TaxID=747481 RepID=A0ABV6DSA1_9BACL